MFENLRNDYRLHGRRMSDRAFWALVAFRFGNWAMGRRWRPTRWIALKFYGVLRVVSQILTSVSLEAGTAIGKDFHIIHADGPIAIHPDAVIGDRCGIMHNVTIGLNMRPGAPVIGDDVFIGVGACILGEIEIGDRVRISANTLVVEDVPADSIAIGVPARCMPSLGLLGRKQVDSEVSQGDED